MMKSKNFWLVCLCMILAAAGTAQGLVPVTFQVDMNNETVSADGVHVAGGFQGWDPAATLLTDDDLDGVYEVTVDLPVNSTHEFKFINGNSWEFVEDVPPTCQVEIAVNNNRFIHIPAGSTGETYAVCWESCAACGLTSVRFRVDMVNEEAISPNGVHVAGNFQGWDPGATALADPDGDGVWETIESFDANEIPDGFLIFKFINGNSWTNPNENLSGFPCSDDYGLRVLEFTSDNMVLSADDDLSQAPCYNSCGACVPPTSVTFRVDMTTQATVSVNGVHVAGSFQGWNPSGSPLSDDDGDGIWEVTMVIEPGDYEFKFVNGNAWGGNGDGNVDNELIVGDCAAAGSDSRALIVGSEAIVYEVCYNSCEAECSGCTDPNACNYNPNALQDNGSCEYESCAGCLDESACNFDSGATISSPELCEYPGCLDPGATNYDPSAGCAGTCIYLTFDCASIGELAWGAEAMGLFPDWQEAMHGVPWEGEWVFNVPATIVEPGSSVSYGVHHVEWSSLTGIPDWAVADYLLGDLGASSQHCIAASGTPIAPGLHEIIASGEVFISIFGQPFSIGEQTYSAWLEVVENPNPIPGCTYANAFNFVSYANDDDGSCQFAGCTDATAGNFNPIATIDDGSCGEACDPSGDSTCQSDNNGDGVVNVTDLLALLGEFGAVCE